MRNNIKIPDCTRCTNVLICMNEYRKAKCLRCKRITYWCFVETLCALWSPTDANYAVALRRKDMLGPITFGAWIGATDIKQPRVDATLLWCDRCSAGHSVETERLLKCIATNMSMEWLLETKDKQRIWRCYYSPKQIWDAFRCGESLPKQKAMFRYELEPNL